MPSRKTIPVLKVLELANTRLSNGGTSDEDEYFRRGVASLLEQILHDSGNYAGYGYIGEVAEDRRSYYYSSLMSAELRKKNESAPAVEAQESSDTDIPF